MKLLRVLVLIALPFFCFAGSGCPLLEEVVNKTIDPQVSMDEYQNLVRPYYTSHPDSEEAMRQLKQCFLSQSSKTLRNAAELPNMIYESNWCVMF
ncbi:mammaglobin-A-like [Lontra canadensis]|uniref:mammaglobin-A-like n=1 Tax=Lontra canadensis TaxID=76717 RepID=UPI0013F364D4|nr:mammaglobin-A-like [Lontra canadensis]